jgi:hypothetical protein
MSQNIDAAVARLNGRRGIINDQFEFGPIRGVTRPTVGMKVVKSGRRTGITHGEIVGVGGATKMQYQFREAVIQNVVTIESREISSEYSLGGDSGSIVINEETQEAIGLHFAGNSFFDTGLAIDIRYVLSALNVDILTTTPMIVTPGLRRMAQTGAGQPEMVRV